MTAIKAKILNVNNSNNNPPECARLFRFFMISDSFAHESCFIIKLTLPIIVTSMLSVLMNLVDITMVGHLGRIELAAASLANTWYNALFFPLQGALSALDTLFSQCYGAGNYSLYGDWLLTGLFISILLAFPGIILMTLTTNFMLLFGQEEEISVPSGEFCFYLSFGYFPLLGFLVYSKYLQSQHILAPLVWIGLFCNILNAFLNYIFINYTDTYKFQGVAIATSLSQWIQFILVILYSFKYVSKKQTWPKFSTAPFKLSRIIEFMKLGIFGAIMVAEESWAFEFTTLLAGLLGTVALDTHICILSIVGFMFNALPFPISTAGTIRLGHLLGTNDPRSAVRASQVIFILTIFGVFITSGVTFLSHHVIGHMFTSDEEVILEVSHLILIVSIVQIFDGIQCCGSGLFRGMGKHHTVALLNFFSFWVFGLGLGASLAFHTELGLAGIWWGNASGVICTSVLMVIMMSRVDWAKEAQNARLRAYTETTHNSLRGMIVPLTEAKKLISNQDEEQLFDDDGEEGFDSSL